MHLLQSGFSPDETLAVDLKQPPADIIFITAATTEVQLLSKARLQKHYKAYSIRAALLQELAHDFSVDLYKENTLKKAKLIVVRLLGGISYWPYGVEVLTQLAQETGCLLCFLSGQDKDDTELKAISNIAPDMRDALHHYCQEGGVENYQHFLTCCTNIINKSPNIPPIAPLSKVGIYGKKYQKPHAIVLCYRAFVHAGDMGAIDALQQCAEEAGFPILVIYANSLKDASSYKIVASLIKQYTDINIIINCCSFSLSGGLSAWQQESPFFGNYPVIQAVHASIAMRDIKKTMRGLPARDTAMAVTLPELDGTILGASIASKEILYYDRALRHHVIGYKAIDAGIDKIIALGKNYRLLQQKNNNEKKIAIILSNYPNSDGRLANGVGLDTPKSLANMLHWLRLDGYNVGDKGKTCTADDAQQWMDDLRANITNYIDARKHTMHYLPHDIYEEYFAKLPTKMQQQVNKKWGSYKNSPYSDKQKKAFKLSYISAGNVVIGVQPSRGYEVDIEQTYHDTTLPPTHYYIAFYIYAAWCHNDAYVHLGKHGNLEWLPGRALSQDWLSFPFAILAHKPNAYPFIINDPGEGTQAKRRIHAHIISHLMPPMVMAEEIGGGAQLEWQIDEYYHASSMDPSRCAQLKKNIIETATLAGIDKECALMRIEDDDEKLQQLDNYLCQLKDLQIRGGLHILGEEIDEALLPETLLHLVQYKRLNGEDAHESFIEALKKDLHLTGHDEETIAKKHWQNTPLESYITKNRTHISPEYQHKIWRDYALDIIKGKQATPGKASQMVMTYLTDTIAQHLQISAPRERDALLHFLQGLYGAAGPSGAPTRGKAEILPSGKNFYSLDIRAVPSPAAWRIGQQSAQNVIIRHAQEQGEYPSHIVLSAWGSANMRTSGDDIAQAFAFMGVQPTWDKATGRVTGFDIIPKHKMSYPRIAVTLRISGFFRDAFSHVITLFQQAVSAVIALDDEGAHNQVRTLYQQNITDLKAQNIAEDVAEKMAHYAIFSAAEGSYGMGLQQLIDTSHWRNKKDLAQQVLHWGHTAYTNDGQSVKAKKAFANRMQYAQAVVHNQDNREHDILDSDDYYQFEGGLSALVEQLSGKIPHIWHNDHSNPDKPVTKSLQEEIGTIIRARATNPKWMRLIQKHGYKGAFEMAATVDYLFAFAATTHCVSPQHFDLLFEQYIINDEMRNFVQKHNEQALQDMLAKFDEALTRGLWQSKRNDIATYLDMYYNKQ